MNKLSGWYRWFIGTFLATLFALPVVAQVSGTNAVTVLDDNITNASTTAWPLVIGIITALVALGVFMKIGRRAGARA